MTEGQLLANHITGGAVSYATIALQYVAQEAQFEAVNHWLQDVDTPIGAAKHIMQGLSAEALTVLQSPLTGPRSKANNYIQYWESAFHLSPRQAELTNELWQLFGQPNIEGIVIFTEKEEQQRQIEVSEQALIVQANNSSNEYVLDNAVPHPRKWSLSGELTVILPTDNYLVIKPSIVLQKQYLDNAARSRRPVWFKTWDNTFVKVLIADIKTAWDPRSLNTLDISLTLVEYVPFTVDDDPMTREIAAKIRSGAA